MDKRFSNYSTAGIHYDMLHDEARTNSYFDAITKNSKSFEGKIVADVGSGTGILSLFAAKAGAKKVYAIECSEIANISEKIIKDNGYENVISIIRGESETVELPEKVDIIISEWMGYSLYYEVMLPAVLAIRDKYLKEGGSILPSEATLYLNAIDDPEYRSTNLNYWDDVYNFNFSAMRELALKEPVIEMLHPSFYVLDPVVISKINIHNCTKENIFFKKEFQIHANKRMRIDAFATYFDVFFGDMEYKTVLSTSPNKKQTHWRNTLFYLEEPIKLNEGEKVEGIIEFAEHPRNNTSLIIHFTYCINDKILKKQTFDFN